jgi:hypothetical protein
MMTYLFKQKNGEKTMSDKPYWCFSEYKHFTIETDENGTWVSVNTDSYDVPSFAKDNYSFSSEDDNKWVEALKIRTQSLFPNFFNECGEIGEVRSTDPREIIEHTHEIIYHLFSHDIERWVLRQYENFDNNNFLGL